MTKNKLMHLNDHLFMQLERLGDEDLTPEQIEVEAKRAKAIVAVSSQIIDGARTFVSAAEVAGKYNIPLASVAPQIENKTK